MNADGDLFDRYNLTRIVNASGTMTSLGSSRVDSSVIRAMAAVLPEFISMGQLQARASSVIARLTGAEAGCVTSSAASGIVLSVAAAMTGMDIGRIEGLPDSGLPRNEVLLQIGHAVSFGASLAQMARLAGAKVRYVGSVNECSVRQVKSMISESTAATLFVVSHHANQSGLIPLQELVAACHERGIPVVVDAASEYGMRSLVALGADVTIFSGHKFLRGPTSGIVAGRLALIKAIHANQEGGIGRCMKVGKEGIIGAMAALERWESEPHDERGRSEDLRTERAIARLSMCASLRVERSPDPTGNPITRVRVHLDQTRAGIPLRGLVDILGAGSPSIRVRDHHIDMGFFELDPCNVTDDEMDLVCSRIVEILEKTDSGQAAAVETTADKWSALQRWPDA